MVLVIAKFRQHAIFLANIFVHTVLTDLLLLFMCHRHVNNCIQLSTLRGATISNAVFVSTTDFLSSKVKFIHTSTVTCRIFVTEKLRVRLAYILLTYIIQ